MILDKRITALILMDLGYEIQSDWKFKIRAKERTPSASIDKNGKIKDFGTGWYGDIVDFLKCFHNFKDVEAFKLANNYKGSARTLEFIRRTRIPQEKCINNVPIKQSEIDYYIKGRLENFAVFNTLLKDTLPFATYEQRKEIATKYEIGYDATIQRLIMPIRDMNGDCATLWKYSPKRLEHYENRSKIQPKVIFSKNRVKPPFNIAQALENSKTNGGFICIAEGEKDCLNAICYGVNAFSLGSATSRLDEKYLPLFANKKVLIAYDYDESGINGANNLAQTLAKSGAKVTIINWEYLSRQYGFRLEKGFDLTDYFNFLNKNKEKNIKKEKKAVEYGI